MLNFKLAAGDFQGDMVPTSTSGKDQNGVPAKILYSESQTGPGNALYSPGGAFRLHLQNDGNAVVEGVDDATLPTKWETGQVLDPNKDVNWLKPPLWASGTNDQAVTEVAMQWDGNLVAYHGDGAAFSSDTDNHQGAYLRMQDDGNLVIYSREGGVLWSTGTYAGGH